jgi:UDP-glucose 4-epimerase
MVKSKKKVLVTGGAGYIGSVTSKILLENNFDVLIIDNLSAGRISAIPKGAKFIKGDISDKNLLEKIFNKNKYDCVIHFACFIRIEESMINPQKYFDNNIVAGLTLLQAMIATKSCRKIIFSSSAAVYGVPKKIPLTEDAIMEPINPYGQTKMLFEIILKEYARAGLIDYVALRYFNVAGAYISKDGDWGESHEPESHIIPLILRSVNTNKVFSIFGDDYETPDGTCVRDYIHVRDLAQAHILAMNKKFKGGLVYNVGTGQGFSNKQVFETAKQVTGVNMPYKIGPRRAGDCPFLVASATKIQKELGFKPLRTDLHTIITDAWQYIKKTL